MRDKSACRRLVILLSVVLPILLTLPTVHAQAPALEVACPSCDDFQPCTLDTCDTSTGTCRHEPLSCDDQNPCTTDACVPVPGPVGGCRHTQLAAGTACDDSSSCTTSD